MKVFVGQSKFLLSGKFQAAMRTCMMAHNILSIFSLTMQTFVVGYRQKFELLYCTTNNLFVSRFLPTELSSL
jgi:hypothetical protein